MDVDGACALMTRALKDGHAHASLGRGVSGRMHENAQDN
jgi:hypothetical protein